MKFPLKDEIWENRQYPELTWDVKFIGSGFVHHGYIGRGPNDGAAIFVVVERNPAEGVEPGFEIMPVEIFLRDYKLST